MRCRYKKMKRFITRFSENLIRYRYGFLGLCLIISLFFAYQLKNLSFKTNLGDFYPLKHPYLEIQNRLNKVFGGLNQVSIAVEVKNGNILNTDTLTRVWKITEELYLSEGINAGRVVSLSSRKVKYVEANNLGFTTEWMMHDPPETQPAIDLLQQRIIRSPLVYGPIVSKDFKATLIQADFESEVSSRQIFNLLQDIKKQYEDSNHRIYISGFPVLQGWLDFYLPQITGLFVFTVLAIAYVLFRVFKSMRGVFLPLLSAAMATLWGLGITSVCGYKLTPSTVLVPFLVFALGVSHTVQYIKRYYECVSKHGKNSMHAASEVSKSLFVPAFCGLLTDGIAPLGLYVVPLGIIKSLAVAIGFGVLSIFFATVILVPVLLSFMKQPEQVEVLREEKDTFINKALGLFTRLALRSNTRRVTIVIFFVLTAAAIFGASRLEVGDKNPGTSLLYGNSPYNQAEKFISERFATSDPYYIFVEGKAGNTFLKSEALKEMDGLQRYLEREVSGVGRSLSLVEYIKGMNMLMFGADPAQYRIPDNDKTIAEYLFLYSSSSFPGDFDPVVDPTYQYANIKVDLKDHKVYTIRNVIGKTEEWIRQNHRFQDINFYYAGGNIGMIAAVNQIVSTMLPVNFLQTSFLVFICLVFIYGSLVSGWLLIIPLILRTFLVFGILGFLKVGLTSEMIPMVALGIGFGDDFAIYIVSRIKEELKEGGGELKDALMRAMSTSGKAVFFTGIALTIGIATWMFSGILMQARLGALLSFFILFNVIGTLIVLPSMIMTVNPKFLRR